MKKITLSAILLGFGLSVSYCATMAAEIHVIVKNGFHDADATVTVSKLTDLKDISIKSDTLTDAKLLPTSIGKSSGELVLMNTSEENFSKKIMIQTSSGECAVDINYANGRFAYAGETGSGCDYAATILKQDSTKYFLILEFQKNDY